MLAKTPVTDTYLTAEQLGISEAERDALIWVREELASGRIKHAERGPFGEGANANRTHFNMATANCGSAVCICGWMRVSLQKRIPLGGTFADLFSPTADKPFAIELLTPSQAVRAIDFWAAGHQADCWALALSED